jgi:hypothetical protein
VGRHTANEKKNGTESRENAGQIECIKVHFGAIRPLLRLGLCSRTRIAGKFFSEIFFSHIAFLFSRGCSKKFPNIIVG